MHKHSVPLGTYVKTKDGWLFASQISSDTVFEAENGKAFTAEKLSRNSSETIYNIALIDGRTIAVSVDTKISTFVQRSNGTRWENLTPLQIRTMISEYTTSKNKIKKMNAFIRPISPDFRPDIALDESPMRIGYDAARSGNRLPNCCMSMSPRQKIRLMTGIFKDDALNLNGKIVLKHRSEELLADIRALIFSMGGSAFYDRVDQNILYVLHSDHEQMKKFISDFDKTKPIEKKHPELSKQIIQRDEIKSPKTVKSLLLKIDSISYVGQVPTMNIISKTPLVFGNYVSIF